MKKRALHGVLVLAALVSTTAVARDAQPCDPATLIVVGKHIGRSDLRLLPSETPATKDRAVIAAVCKRWPDSDRLMAAAVAYHPPGYAPKGGWERDHLIVALVDSQKGRVVQSYQATIEEDSSTQLDENSLWLDTARYQLAADVRALGVVVSSAAKGPSCPDGNVYDELTLLAPEGDKLRPVFVTNLRAWGTLTGSACDADAGVFVSESASLTIDMAPGVSNGFADLIVTAHAQTDSEGPNWVKPANKVRIIRRTVHYDGKRYPFDEFPSFWQSKS